MSDRPVSAKFAIAGGFGAGKTTFVGSVSDIAPLKTEGSMTMQSFGVDDASALPDKTTTTVAMDFGRIGIEENLMLYLFGTPGQDRFGFMWDDVTRGSLGAIVVADTRRLEDCYPAVDFFESRQIPFVVALNQFDASPLHEVAEVRGALGIPEDIPIMRCDARDKESVREILVGLCLYILARIGEPVDDVPSPTSSKTETAADNGSIASVR